MHAPSFSVVPYKVWLLLAAGPALFLLAIAYLYWLVTLARNFATHQHTRWRCLGSGAVFAGLYQWRVAAGGALAKPTSAASP